MRNNPVGYGLINHKNALYLLWPQHNKAQQRHMHYWWTVPYIVISQQSLLYSVGCCSIHDTDRMRMMNNTLVNSIQYCPTQYFFVCCGYLINSFWFRMTPVTHSAIFVYDIYHINKTLFLRTYILLNLARVLINNQKWKDSITNTVICWFESEEEIELEHNGSQKFYRDTIYNTFWNKKITVVGTIKIAPQLQQKIKSETIIAL